MSSIDLDDIKPHACGHCRPYTSLIDLNGTINLRSILSSSQPSDNVAGSFELPMKDLPSTNSIDRSVSSSLEVIVDESSDNTASDSKGSSERAVCADSNVASSSEGTDVIGQNDRKTPNIDGCVDLNRRTL